MHVNRRDALAMMAASTVLAACSSNRTRAEARPSANTSKASTTPKPIATKRDAEFTSAPIPTHPISTVPAGSARQIALTIDDGVESDVVAGYAQLCRRTGMRLTFFANGRYASWRDNRDALAPLIHSGQVVIGNHTLDHPDIRRRNITATQLAHQITANETVFHDLFGSDFSMKPYFRPPFGYYDRASLAQVTSMGYDAVVMWYGTTGDDQAITSNTIMKNVRTWSAPGRIVIGHANHPGVLKDFDAIHELFEARRLTPVTIADAYPRNQKVK